MCRSMAVSPVGVDVRVISVQDVKVNRDMMLLFVNFAVGDIPARADAIDLDELLRIGIPCAIKAGEVGVGLDQCEDATVFGFDDDVLGETFEGGDIVRHGVRSLCFVDRVTI